MVVIVIMYVYSLRVGELRFPTLLSTWFLGNYFPYTTNFMQSEKLHRIVPVARVEGDRGQ